MRSSVILSSFYDKIVLHTFSFVKKSNIPDNQNLFIPSFAILLFCGPNNCLGAAMN